MENLSRSNVRQTPVPNMSHGTRTRNSFTFIRMSVVMRTLDGVQSCCEQNQCEQGLAEDLSNHADRVGHRSEGNGADVTQTNNDYDNDDDEDEDEHGVVVDDSGDDDDDENGDDGSPSSLCVGCTQLSACSPGIQPHQENAYLHACRTKGRHISLCKSTLLTSKARGTPPTYPHD